IEFDALHIGRGGRERKRRRALRLFALPIEAQIEFNVAHVVVVRRDDVRWRQRGRLICTNDECLRICNDSLPLYEQQHEAETDQTCAAIMCYTLHVHMFLGYVCKATGAEDQDECRMRISECGF